MYTLFHFRILLNLKKVVALIICVLLLSLQDLMNLKHLAALITRVLLLQGPLGP